MKPPLCLLLIALSYGSVSAQTNSSLAPRGWFSLPSAQLRPVSPETHNSMAIAGQPVSLTNTVDDVGSGVVTMTNGSTPVANYRNDRLNDQVVLDSYLGEFDYRTYRLLYESDFLKRPEPEPDDLFSRVANEIFKPEPFRIGKTTVCFSVVTAMKRKNPLCLLNPMVLNMSW